MKIYVVIYSVSSVQRLLDFVKTAYAFNNVIPVIIKPIGAAAQIGVPEANKIAYRREKPLLILPELSDLKELLEIDSIYFITSKGILKDFKQLIKTGHRIALVIHGGEADFTKQELQYGESIWVNGLSREAPPYTALAIILYEYIR